MSSVSTLYSFMLCFDLRFRNRVDWAVAGDRSLDAPLNWAEVILLAKQELYAIQWEDEA